MNHEEHKPMDVYMVSPAMNSMNSIAYEEPHQLRDLALQEEASPPITDPESTPDTQNSTQPSLVVTSPEGEGTHSPTKKNDQSLQPNPQNLIQHLQQLHTTETQQNANNNFGAPSPTTTSSPSSSSSSTSSSPSSSTASTTTSTEVNESHDIISKINENLTLKIPSICPFIQTKDFPLPIIKVKSTEGTKSGLPLVKLSVSFSGCIYLRQNSGGNSTTPMTAEAAEEYREKIKNIVVRILDEIMNYGVTRLGIRPVFSHVDLSDTEASMRAIFNGTCCQRPIHRETEVEFLDLSRTKTSPHSLTSLYRLCHLKELYLDHCPQLVDNKKQVFNTLQKKDFVPRLEILSMVETSSTLSHTWLSDIQSACPMLEKIYFTRKKDTKAIGWHDSIMMQTMRRPHLLPCGHIGDKDTLAQFGYCSFDRQPFRSSELLPLNPVITALQKDKSNNTWTAMIVDFHRKPLDSKVLYHNGSRPSASSSVSTTTTAATNSMFSTTIVNHVNPTGGDGGGCGCFFNLETIHAIFSDVPETSINDSIINTLQRKQCPYCKEKMTGLRVCFPHSAEALDNTDFSDLKHVGAYSVAGMMPAIIPVKEFGKKH